MPGIHIRALSQFDWLDQEKESLLIIPGSYWLCHKKNIYKFIFRYHRAVKNTMQFSYGRELLKIIRRIIKCHPTQGQQFGTQHLLVTYSCTSWTRQDKMFAILKFQQRTNAATFSHAFVLTIRICPSSEHSLFDLKYPFVKEADAGTTFKDLNVSLDTETNIITTEMSATDKVSPRKAAIYQSKEINQISKYNAIENMLSDTLKTTMNSDPQDNNIKDVAIFHESLDERFQSATTTAEMHFVDKHDTEFHNNIQECKSINCNTKRCERNVEQYSVDCVREQPSLITTKKLDELEIKKTDDTKEEKKAKPIIIPKENQEMQDIQKYKIFSSLKPFAGMMKGGVNEWLLSNRFNFDEKLIERDGISINNKDNLNNNKETTNENIIDPNNVPYQYFIEKEIQNAKHNLIIDQVAMQKNLQTEVKNINKDCVPKMMKRKDKSIHTKQKDHYNEITNLESQESNKQDTTSININDEQSQNNMYDKSYNARNNKEKGRESERKTVPDKILRSSNITDLVMEGLMFTIRQDQDSVSVIEQKTKLEMDEVLENSEKVETKAGEKCLLNSSLLRLENLITMIDPPRNKDEQNENCRTSGNDTNLPPFNVFPNDAVYNVHINYVDAGVDQSNVSNYDRHNTLNYLNRYESGWQHKRVSSSIKNSDTCFSRMEWQSSDNEQSKKYKNDTEIGKEEEEDIIPEMFPSKRTNAGLQNTDSLTIDRDIEEIDKCDKSTEGHYSSPLSYSLLNPRKMSTKKVSIISKEPSLIKLSRQEANLPRIVSDKAITIEQMSPALQKVLQHTCGARGFSSTTSGGMLQREQKMQHVALTGDTISESDILIEDKFMDSNVASNSLSIKFTIDSEKTKNSNEKCCVMMEKDDLEADKDTRVKNLKRKSESHRILRRSSSSKHGSPRKLQDITEEFYYDLLHIHNKDNAIRQRCLRQKQKSLNNLDDIKSGQVRIEMLKFIQDITEGARVVVRRLNIDDKSNLLEQDSNLI